MLSAHLRARLASFSHAYSVALRLREQTGLDQYIVQTADPLQPVRVSAVPPKDANTLLALVA